MAEPLEGWRVPWRPAAIAAAITPVALLVVLLLAGWGYWQALRPATFRTVTPFPAPGLETKHVRAGRDPDPPEPAAAPDPAIVAAKARVAAGLPGWHPLDPPADCAAARSPSCAVQQAPATVAR